MVTTASSLRVQPSGYFVVRYRNEEKNETFDFRRNTNKTRRGTYHLRVTLYIKNLLLLFFYSLTIPRLTPRAPTEGSHRRRRLTPELKPTLKKKSFLRHPASLYPFCRLHPPTPPIAEDTTKLPKRPPRIYIYF